MNLVIVRYHFLNTIITCFIRVVRSAIMSHYCMAYIVGTLGRLRIHGNQFVTTVRSISVTEKERLLFHMKTVRALIVYYV